MILKDSKKQALEFDEFDTNSLDQLAKLAIIMDQYHPWAVLRASELIKWKDSGEYEKILNKDTSKSIFCTSCHKELELDNIYCGECGDEILSIID